ncbi:MAG: ABC transporter ATP-binding protein [Clostridiales bacterium]|nr:ABC transporter ATP-binding protein [Clostridiales bacterium]
METAIKFENVTKTFGTIVANKDINFDVKKGEILALLGENGSGKTTLCNMLAGIYFPDHGNIYINDEVASIRSPHDAYRYHIGMVHQHFKLVDIFTAVENVVLGLDPKEFKFDIKAASNKIKEICDKYGFEVDPNKKVYNMSVSEKQTLEIVKVLYRGADILILDEPTAVLTPQEADKLFNVMRNMKADGKSIIIITHKLQEVLSISDRVAILRKGAYIDTVETKSATTQSLTDMMVGQKVDLNIDRPEVKHDIPLLEIRDLTIKNDEGATAIDNVSFYIRGGEILGIAGIAGCGQKELCEAIAGLRKVESGDINHLGKSIIGMKPKEIIDEGIAMSFIPEDRLGMGLAPSLSITDNMMLKTYKDNAWYNPFVDRKHARNKANRLIRELEIATPSSETPVRRLSGGNVQKVLVGREISAGPNVIVTAYPVRGLDINSSYLIYNILNEQKKKGVGVLFVGEDLDVLLGLCDKIMVLCHGRVMGVVHADKTTKEEIGLMMTGSLDLTEVKKDKEFGIAEDSFIPVQKVNSEEIIEKFKEEGVKEDE